MSRNRYEVLERFAPLFEAPDPSFELFLRRRDRKVRSQRIVAAAVAVAVFALPAWIVATAGPPDQPPAPADSSTATEPPDLGLIGLPPAGSVPSAPERGELVVTYYGRPEFGVLQVLVYADGRVISREENGSNGANGIRTGFLEQRFTPEGVELLRSEVISSGLFDRDHHFDEGRNVPYADLIWGEIRVDDGDRLVSVRWGEAIGTPDSATTPEQARALRRLNDLFSDLASTLPESSWEDSEAKAYVPSRYAICYSHGQWPLEPSEVVNLLPAPAEDLLRGRDRTYRPNEGGGGGSDCSEVTTEEARRLEAILRDAGSERHHPTTLTTGSLEYAVPASPPIERAFIRFEPILPHGTWSLFPG